MVRAGYMDFESSHGRGFPFRIIKSYGCGDLCMLGNNVPGELRSTTDQVLTLQEDPNLPSGCCFHADLSQNCSIADTSSGARLS